MPPANTSSASGSSASGAAAPTAPTAQQLLAKLTVDEAKQVVTAVTPSLTSLATGDGTATSIAGNWLALQGAFLANKSIFQKIGVNDLASALLAFVNQIPALVAAQVDSSGPGAA